MSEYTKGSENAWHVAGTQETKKLVRLVPTVIHCAAIWGDMDAIIPFDWWKWRQKEIDTTENRTKTQSFHLFSTHRAALSHITEVPSSLGALH